MSYNIKRIPVVWIAVRDGVKLATKLWLPEPVHISDEDTSSGNEKYPAILEFLPYRRLDWTAQRDEKHYSYFCSHGYACVRVDIRGSGDSEGFYYDEYESQEQEDCCDVISWISRQTWCTGSVGMFGKSWGGFNGLQVAACQPLALKAVISTYSSDDRYNDDVHYRDGCILGNEMLSWAHTMFMWNARPPHPKSLGTRWKEVWLERLHKSTEPWIHKWLSHQTRDHYWEHGSVCEDYGAIKCPVLLIGGFSDLYTDSVFRMMEHLTCPLKALIGPWSHDWPANSTPGPQIDHLKECLRWWDCHLKGLCIGIMEEPTLRLFQRESVSHAFKKEVWSGKWIAEDVWPSPNVQHWEYSLQDGGGLTLTSDTLQQQRLPEDKSILSSGSSVAVKSSCLCGSWGGIPLSFSLSDLPVDQRMEDELSECWETMSLRQPVALFGFPKVHLQVSSDRPWALVAARLCDVFPDGESSLITRGVLNLTHRDGHSPDVVQPLQPHTVFSAQVRLDSIAYTVAAGHKIRLALSSVYWPFAWPSPLLSRLSIQTEPESKLILPVRVLVHQATQRDAELEGFESQPQFKNTLPVEWCREPSKTRVLGIDQLSDTYKLTIVNDDGCVLLKDTNTIYDESKTEVYTIEENKPTSAKVTIEGHVILKRQENAADQDDSGRIAWDTKVQAFGEMWADEKFFYVMNNLKAWDRGEGFFDKTWTEKIERFCV